MPNTLFMALQGPMQSWGERGRWSVRDSALFPTKSGIVGMLGCALGWSSDADLGRLSRAIDCGMRADNPGEVLIDYHTVTSGVLTAAGKLKVNARKEPETQLSYRHYLCDAAFVVALQGDSALLDECADAIRNPVWPPYLGRKSCVLSRPLYDGQGEYEDLLQALSQWPRLLPKTAAQEQLLVEIPAPFGHGLRRSDVLVSRSRRQFAYRSVRQTLVDPPDREGMVPCFSPS